MSARTRVAVAVWVVLAFLAGAPAGAWVQSLRQPKTVYVDGPPPACAQLADASGDAWAAQAGVDAAYTELLDIAVKTAEEHEVGWKAVAEDAQPAVDASAARLLVLTADATEGNVDLAAAQADVVEHRQVLAGASAACRAGVAW